MALNLSRKLHETVVLETPGVPPITITVAAVHHGRVQLSFAADPATRILRGELSAAPRPDSLTTANKPY